MNKDQRQTALKGVTDSLGSPGLVLIVTFFAFGSLANSLDAPLMSALGLTAFVFAIPGQVVLLDELARGSSPFAAFLATTLTALRLFPLTMSMMPLLRSDKTPKSHEVFLAHFVAVTVWVQSMLALPDIEKTNRTSYCTGLVTGLLTLTLVSTYFGYISASYLPSGITAILLMVTPIYFFLSLIEVSKNRADQLAFLFGTVFGAVLIFVAPSYALLISGLGGGTLAYYLARNTSSNEGERND